MESLETLSLPIGMTPSFELDAHLRGSVLVTERLTLEPMSLAMVEAVLKGDRRRLERLIDARLPSAWPGEQLVHQGFGCSFDEMCADAAKHLWGCRLMISRPSRGADSDEERDRQLVGSVVFHGRPGHCMHNRDGVADVGYGVEEGSRGFGYATEGTLACVRWALTQPGVQAVRATTAPWHQASLRVIEKLGMRRSGVRDHELVGELWEFSLRRDDL